MILHTKEHELLILHLCLGGLFGHELLRMFYLQNKADEYDFNRKWANNISAHSPNFGFTHRFPAIRYLLTYFLKITVLSLYGKITYCRKNTALFIYFNLLLLRDYVVQLVYRMITIELMLYHCSFLVTSVQRARVPVNFQSFQ